MFADAFGGQEETLTLPPAPKDIVISLDCTLYEFFNGCMKTISFDREKLQHDGRTTKAVNEEVRIEVRPGFSKDTVLTFPSKGHEAYAHKQSALVIKFIEMPDAQFKRKGNDLIYTHSLSLSDAIVSAPVCIKNLAGKSLVLTLDEVIAPATLKMIKGEGLPINKEKEDSKYALLAVAQMDKGDLYIRFDIQFPKRLSEDHKITIVDALKVAQEMEEEENA